jgi:2-methylcitrate dehydratase PrpD
VTAEYQLAEFVTRCQPGDASVATLETMHRVLLASVGTGIAGAGEAGIAELRHLLRTRGGNPEARTLIFGDVLPAHAAAQLNGTMCRALDYCDAMAPGSHLGSAVIPAAFAAMDLAGGCSGLDLMAAILVGCEVGARLNLTESMYDGFDPTGVSVVFASTAAASRLLRLSPQQTQNALGLALNRCGGSFQSNIDATLAVRVIQGWVAQAGLECAQMALAGITGPANFLSGVYGYCHLFGRDRLDAQQATAGLGDAWWMNRIVFKKFPSCGATQGLTEILLQFVTELALTPEHVSHVELRLNPYCHRLVGNPFKAGDYPRVSAQFSAQYCAANAIARKSSKLAHFTPSAIADPALSGLINRITCLGDPALDERGHSAVDVTVTTTQGKTHTRSLDVPPGFPGNELSDEDHLDRFAACMEYAPYPLPAGAVKAFLDGLDRLPRMGDARNLIGPLTVPNARSPHTADA